jgi:1-acyl-sn-glycerol-3-phosphate acyltransferase
VSLYPLVDRLTRPVMNHAYRIRHIGAERIPATGPVVLAANHESIIDPWFLGTATPRPVHYLAKAELFRYPVVKQILDGLGCIPVRRQGDLGRAASAANIVLERGEVVGLFPQGTCLPYRVRPYRRGAARLALAAGAPVVPVLLVGTERSIQPRTGRIGFPEVTIVVGEPLPTAGVEATRKAAVELTARLEAAIAALRKPYGEPDHAWFDDPPAADS